MNSLTPDRKEYEQQVHEHNAGFKGGAWFVVIFILLMTFAFFVVNKCTHNPLQEKKQTTDTTQAIKDTVIIGEYIHEENLDSIIKTLPIGTTELVFDEKEDLTRAIDDGLFDEKLDLEKPEL